MMRPLSKRPNGRSAFTLIEIMISIGILAMVVAAIYSTWTAILRASKSGKDAAAAVQRARITGRIIEEALGSTLFFTQNQGLYAFVAKNGDDAQLSFVAKLASSFPRSGTFGDLDVRRVTFALESSRDSGGRELVMSQMPLLNKEEDVDEKRYPVVLAKNVREFKTEFWDLKTEDWIDEWKQTNQLPPMVKVTLKLADAAHSSMVREEVMRVVSLPSVAVDPRWQPWTRGQGARGGVPPAPGTTPPGATPNPAILNNPPPQ
jgi:prepilin-type N-terminal cleavage/methylation domain-containing protein